MKANWEIGAENFAGDMYHTPQTHTLVVEIGLFREPKAEKRKDGATYWAGAGGGTTYKLPDDDLDKRLRYVGYPQEMVDRMKKQFSEDQLREHGPTPTLGAPVEPPIARPYGLYQTDTSASFTAAAPPPSLRRGHGTAAVELTR